MVLTSFRWHFLERHVYDAALFRLGYDHTRHGWDIIFERPIRAKGWTRLARRKWLRDDDVPRQSGEIRRQGRGNGFAAEMIQAYPEAKVVLNTRRDLDPWMGSMQESLVAVNRNWSMYILFWFDRALWWVWHVYERLLWPGLFRCIDSREGFVDAVTAKGIWVYREHCNMVGGMVPKDRLLEWTVKEGWEPLCEFLGKDVPDEPFPQVNAKSKG
ncbi:hypothetical protein DL768_005655 [Monosporascus sp. mg162]|nr:hypothetical protein DL768_005655 [Monosporascus sp. mg162]